MCRPDYDDYEWLVEATFRETVSEPTACEDCGRIVQPGETIVRYACERSSEDDYTPYVYVVFWPIEGRRYWLEGEPYVTIIEDDGTFEEVDRRCEEAEILGLRIDEVRDPRVPVERESDHYTCVQCKAAEQWLVKVCSQSQVLVTREDLIEHTHEYDAETLGADFMRLAQFARDRWATDRDDMPVVPESLVVKMTENAIEHAQLIGLHP